MSVSPELFLQFLIAGLVIGVLYALMAIGITFIYSVMKLINWSMGEFYMIGSYFQYMLIVHAGPMIGLPKIPWYIALVLSMIIVFLIGVVLQRLLIKPMFVGGVERRNEYATIITLTMVLLLRSAASAIGGPRQYSPGSYIKDTFYLGPLPVSGDRLAALIGAILIMAVFYIFFKYSWYGVALRAASQSRVGVQTAGVNLSGLDMIAFGVGVALAAGAGALLAPVFLVYPTNGEITTMKGFEIIIIGGLGSIPGALIAGIALGVVESLGAVFINPNFQHVYGFVLLLIILIFRPTGLFGEQEREV